MPLDALQEVWTERHKATCLPGGQGVRVSAAELAKGSSAAGGSAEAGLLADRPLLQQLQYSMRKKNVLVPEVR